MSNGLRARILIVDDVPENLALLGELLQPSHQVKAANSGERALQVLSKGDLPDLILLDIMMPGLDGFQTLERIRANADWADIPVIFLTAMSDVADEEKGLALGAADYIVKPYKGPLVLARINTQLENARARRWLKSYSATLKEEVNRRIADTLMVQDVALRALASLAEARDNETGNHILRTQRYVAELASGLSQLPSYAARLTDERIEQITKAAPLHDIGKVGVPDSILLKPGKLTPEEWAVMRTHPRIGADALTRAIKDALRQQGLFELAEQMADGDFNSEHDHSIIKNIPPAFGFLLTAREIANWHHERWDGTGYPDGLRGSDIPISAQLMALADVFDALICRRVYKPALPMSEVTSLISAGAGTQFNPDIVHVFMQKIEEFSHIAQCFIDE